MRFLEIGMTKSLKCHAFLRHNILNDITNNFINSINDTCHGLYQRTQVDKSHSLWIHNGGLIRIIQTFSLEIMKGSPQCMSQVVLPSCM